MVQGRRLGIGIGCSLFVEEGRKDVEAGRRHGWAQSSLKETWEGATGNVGGGTPPWGSGQPPTHSGRAPRSLHLGAVVSPHWSTSQLGRTCPSTVPTIPSLMFLPDPMGSQQSVTKCPRPNLHKLGPICVHIVGSFGESPTAAGWCRCARMTRCSLPDPSHGERSPIHRIGTMKQSTASGSRCQSAAVRLSAREDPACQHPQRAQRIPVTRTR